MHWIDPDCLPETKGQVERFLINPRGEIDGLVLNGAKNRATLVHVPPHLCADIEAAIRPGETVGVRGVRPRGTDMIAAVALTAADGTAIVDHGPDRNRRDKPRKNGRGAAPVENTKVAGTVRLSLYAPRGELRGALLEDGNHTHRPQACGAFCDAAATRRAGGGARRRHRNSARPARRGQGDRSRSRSPEAGQSPEAPQVAENSKRLTGAVWRRSGKRGGDRGTG